MGIKGPALSLVRIIAVNEAMEARAGWGVRAWEMCRHPWASQGVPGSGGQGLFPGHPAALMLLCICKGAHGIIRSRCHPATAAWEPLSWGNFSHGCWVGDDTPEHTHVCERVRVYTPTREGGTSSGGCQGTTREWPCGSRYPGKRGLHAHEQTCVRVRMMAYGPAYGNNVAVPLLPLWLVGTCTPAGVHAQHPHSPGGVCTHVGVQCTRMAHLPSVCALGKLRERVLPGTSTLRHHPFWLWCSGLEESGAPRQGGPLGLCLISLVLA